MSEDAAARGADRADPMTLEEAVTAWRAHAGATERVMTMRHQKAVAHAVQAFMERMIEELRALSGVAPHIAIIATGLRDDARRLEGALEEEGAAQQEVEQRTFNAFAQSIHRVPSIADVEALCTLRQAWPARPVGALAGEEEGT